METAVYSEGSMTLLSTGTDAFREILSSIALARRSIVINMFIWRDDAIGNRIAHAVLDAADRGVQVEISVDRVGAVLERSEESGKSLFHPDLSVWETIQVRALQMGYPQLCPPKSDEHFSNILGRMLRHDHIHMERNLKKADHSKFYIIDDELLILGGVNIEDKENGCDIRGISYQDYMVKLEGAAYVAAFRKKRNSGVDDLPDLRFIINQKRPDRHFELKSHYLEMIESSRRELTIVMAYFAPVKDIMDAILRADKRGVDVRLMISASANYQDDKNKWAVRTLFAASGGRIKVYLSPFMLHTKLILSDDTVSFGSGNITNQSFCRLDELNLTTDRADFVAAVQKDVERNISDAHLCQRLQELRFHPLRARLEHLFS